MDFPAYVPGYAVERPLGASGLVWAAREEVTGSRVALRLLPLPDPGARERARREIAMLTAVDHPHVLPLLAVADVPGALVLVFEFADGGSLDDLLAARGILSPGEVVTVCAPIAQALTELHARRLVHGHVAPASILFSADGRPMLADVGSMALGDGQPAGLATITPPEVAAGYPPQPAADVYGLAAVAVRALTGFVPTQAAMLPGIPPATQSALAQAMHPDPARRPGAGSLANALFVLADPEPVSFAADSAPAGPALGEMTPAVPQRRSRRAGRHAEPEPVESAALIAPVAPPVLPGPPSTVEPVEAVDAPLLPEVEPSTRRRRERRSRVDIGRIAMVVAIPVILAGAVFAGLQWLGNDDPQTLPGAARQTSPGEADVPVDMCGGPQPAPTQEPPEVSDWTQVVQSLYEQRAEAFNGVDATALCAVYAPTSQVLADDAELLQLYADAGVHTRGLNFEVVTAELVSQEGGRVVLQITDRLPPYQLADDEGTVVAEKEGLPEATWQAELVPAPDASGWRFG